MTEHEPTAPAQEPGGGRRAVVVGFDGSPASSEALRRALGEAAARGVGLDVVAAAPTQLAVRAGLPVAAADAATVRADAGRRIEAAVDEVVGGTVTEVPTGSRTVAVRVRVLEGTPARVLEAAAADADLLVVGTRGRGAVRSALLGSVALHCATQARCPVLVVPAQSSPATTGRPLVLAGVDGSDAAPAVLAEAVREAGLLGADLEVVSAYWPGDLWGDLPTVVGPVAEEIAGRLRATTAAHLAAVTRRLPAPAPRTRVEVVEGPPRDVLVRASRGATVLVVGRSGSGTARGVLFGSVTLHCAVRAMCPVLVVPVRGGVPAPRPRPAGERVAEVGGTAG